MTKTRPSKLHYLAGISRPEGEYFPGVPMRDLEADDIAALTDEQMADITGTPAGYHGPLYQVTKPAAKSEASPPKKKAASKRPVAKPSAPVEPEPVPPDAPETAPSEETGAAEEQT